MAFILRSKRWRQNLQTVAVATSKPEPDVNHVSNSMHPMTREQAIALIGDAVDYSRQRCRVLHSTDRRFDADAVRSEFEEWLNPSGDCLPLMPCPLPKER